MRALLLLKPISCTLPELSKTPRPASLSGIDEIPLLLDLGLEEDGSGDIAASGSLTSAVDVFIVFFLARPLGWWS